MEFDIKDFIQGDKKAFDWVYARYAPTMLGICRRYTRCLDDANEVLQDSFIRVYEQREKMNPEKELGPWIKTITIRTALNFIKKQNRMELHEDDLFFDSSQHEVDETEVVDMKDKLLKVLACLPDGYRSVFNMFVLDGLTHKEIAEYLGITEGTSKSQLAKAKNMIKMNLEKDMVNERI